MTKEQRIIEKLEEIIANLNVMIITPEPTTDKAEKAYTSLYLKDARLHLELSALKSEDSEKYDKDTCCVCHRNYVDSSSGFDT